MEDLYDERFFRMWQFYLAGALVAFRHGGHCNYQIQFIRNRTSLPITRDYQLEREKSLCSAPHGKAGLPEERAAPV